MYSLIVGVYSCQVSGGGIGLSSFEKINPTIRRGFIARALYGVRLALLLDILGGYTR